MEFSPNQPIYHQIADHFCENILTGKWQEDQRIPSVREVAVSLEVNPNTAIRAYELLQNQGIIYNKRGIGYFVSEGGFDKVLKQKREDFLEKAAPEIFRQMEILQIDFETLQKVYKTFRKQ